GSRWRTGGCLGGGGGRFRACGRRGGRVGAGRGLRRGGRGWGVFCRGRGGRRRGRHGGGVQRVQFVAQFLGRRLQGGAGIAQRSLHVLGRVLHLLLEFAQIVEFDLALDV